MMMMTMKNWTMITIVSLEMVEDDYGNFFCDIALHAFFVPAICCHCLSESVDFTLAADLVCSFSSLTFDSIRRMRGKQKNSARKTPRTGLACCAVQSAPIR